MIYISYILSRVYSRGWLKIIIIRRRQWNTCETKLSSPDRFRFWFRRSLECSAVWSILWDRSVVYICEDGKVNLDSNAYRNWTLTIYFNYDRISSWLLGIAEHRYIKSLFYRKSITKSKIIVCWMLEFFKNFLFFI